MSKFGGSVLTSSQLGVPRSSQLRYDHPNNRTGASGGRELLLSPRQCATYFFESRLWMAAKPSTMRSLTADLKRNEMRLHYYADSDSLYVELKRSPGTETREVSNGLNVDLDAAGDVVRFDIDSASTRLDLSTLEVEALPVRSFTVV